MLYYNTAYNTAFERTLESVGGRPSCWSPALELSPHCLSFRIVHSACVVFIVSRELITSDFFLYLLVGT